MRPGESYDDFVDRMRDEAEIAGEAPALARAQETWFKLSSLRERVRSTSALAAERGKHLAPEPEDERRGRDPEELDAEAHEARQVVDVELVHQVGAVGVYGFDRQIHRPRNLFGGQAFCHQL